MDQMIKKILVSGYDRTLGAVWSTLNKSGQSFLTRANWIQTLYVLAMVAFMAGFVNAVGFAVPNQALIVYPASGAMTIPEMVIDAVVILFGASGIYVAYLSGRQTTKSRMVNLYLAVALLLLVVSVFMGIQLSILKTG
jgi:hypothetical protein